MFVLCASTRWSSRINALRPLRHSFEDICNALEDLTDDAGRNISARSQAKNILEKIVNGKFICSLVMWHNIFEIVNVVSKILQDPEQNLSKAKEYLTNLLEFLRSNRCDEKFNDFLDEAKKFSQDVESETKFLVTRIRRKRNHFYYEVADENVVDPKTILKLIFIFMCWTFL